MGKKTKSYKHLSENELIDIYELHRAGRSYQEIGTRVKRSKSTVSECLRWRPLEPLGSWSTMSSVQKAEYQYRQKLKASQSKRTKKLTRDKDLQSFVVEKLKKEFVSPEEIAYLVSKELKKKVCAKTIYTFIKEERAELAQYLLEGGKPRRQRVMHRRGKLKEAAHAMRSISERPERVSEKTEFGHFEGDLLQVRRGYFLSLREMKTRKQFFIMLPSKKARVVRHTLIAFFAQIGKGIIKTITFDRGGEFAPSELSELERLIDNFQLYYCDAYCPYQKGSVENGHRWARKLIPRKSDFSSYNKEAVERINKILNKKPLKCLGRGSPSEAWQAEINKIAA